MTGEDRAASSGLGQSIGRREDARFLRGAGRYLGDRASAVAQVAFVRSSVAAGVIESVDTTEAERSEGVIAVFSGADLAPDIGPLPHLKPPERGFAAALAIRFDVPSTPCIAVDRVRYVGEPVAIVVARDRYVAEDAAELVRVTYRPSSPVMSPSAATAEGADAVNPSNPDNIGVTARFSRGHIPTETAPGNVVVEETFRIGRHSGVPLEGRGVLVEPVGDDRFDVWSSTQLPFVVRRAICTALGWPSDRVRVRVPDVGGGFGPKATVYPEEILLPYVSRRLDRAIAWVEDRYEHLVSTCQSRDQVHRARLEVDADGRIVSWTDDFDVDIGAHNLAMGGVVSNTMNHLLGPYRVPACSLSGKAVFTNKTPTSQYRGAGRPEAVFALERSLDLAARRLGMSGADIRRANLLTAGDFPYSQETLYRDGRELVYDGADYLAVLEACRELLPDAELEQLRATEAEQGNLVGVGVATFVEATGGGAGSNESVRLRLSGDGHLLVDVGTASAGMSHETTLAQVAASTTGLPLADITVRSGDTDHVPHSMGSFASRTAVVAGSAIHQAGEILCDRARRVLARIHDCDVGDIVPVDGNFQLPDGSAVTWKDVAATLAQRADLNAGLALEASARFTLTGATWTMAAHIAVVSVSPRTGYTRVVRYLVADETGRLINPKVVTGQLLGGVAQGIGGALLEEFRYDADGQPLSTSLAEYLLPSTCDVPVIDHVNIEVHSEVNPLGLKGVGESGTIGGCAAIASAVEDALSGFGVVVTETPVGPQMVREFLRAAGA